MKSSIAYGLSAAGLVLGLTAGLCVPGSMHFSALAAEADHHLIPTTKHLWIIYARDLPGMREKIDPKIWQAHLDSDSEEEKNGHRIMGGAVSDAQGKREYGMFIVRAKNADEAMAIAKSDPAVKAGERTVDVHQFEVHQGVMNFHIHFSDGQTTFD